MPTKPSWPACCATCLVPWRGWGLGLEVLYVNQTQAQWVDTEADQIIGKRVPGVIAPALMERMAPYFRSAPSAAANGGV